MYIKDFDMKQYKVNGGIYDWIDSIDSVNTFFFIKNTWLRQFLINSAHSNRNRCSRYLYQHKGDLEKFRDSGKAIDRVFVEKQLAVEELDFLYHTKSLFPEALFALCIWDIPFAQSVIKKDLVFSSFEFDALIDCQAGEASVKEQLHCFVAGGKDFRFARHVAVELNI